MAWLQLTLPVSQAEHPRYEAVLEDAGALSVTLADADAETPDESAIFEPGVGETPLWRQMVLSVRPEAAPHLKVEIARGSVRLDGNPSDLAALRAAQIHVQVEDAAE